MDVVTIGSIGTSAYGLRHGMLHIVSAQKGNTSVPNISEVVTIIGSYRDASNIGMSFSETVNMGCVDPGYVDIAVPAPGRYTVAFGMYSNTKDPVQEVTLNAGQCKTVKQLSTACWNGIKNIINAHKEKEYFKACDILPQDCDLFLDTEGTGNAIRYAVEVATVDTLPNHPHSVVFNTVQVLPHKLKMYPPEGQPNKANNKTGYKFTNVASYLDNSFYESLPSDLKSCITAREFLGASGAVKKKQPMTEYHKVWAPTFTDLSPAYSNAELFRWKSYPEINEYCESIGFQAAAIDIAVQNVDRAQYDGDTGKYRPASWSKAIKYPHYAKPVAGSATLTTYAASKGYSLPSDIDLCRIKTVGQEWVVPEAGLTSTAAEKLFTMSGCRYWTATPSRASTVSYWFCNSIFGTSALNSTASAAISAASTYADKSYLLAAAGSTATYNILPCFMIAADNEYLDQ